MYKCINYCNPTRHDVSSKALIFKQTISVAGNTGCAGAGVIKRLSTGGSITKSEHYTDTDIFSIVVAAMSMLAMVFVLVNLAFS